MDRVGLKIGVIWIVEFYCWIELFGELFGYDRICWSKINFFFEVIGNLWLFVFII